MLSWLFIYAGLLYLLRDWQFCKKTGLSFILSTSKPSSVTFCVFYSSQAAKSSKCSFRCQKTWPKPKVNALILQTTLQTQYRLFSLYLYKTIKQILYFRFRLTTIIIERLGKFQIQGSEGLRKLQMRQNSASL